MIKIWTGPIRSGKTTYLEAYYRDQEGIGGFLTPDSADLRQLYDIQAKEFYEFETQNHEVELISVGRFHFRKDSFDLAVEHMKKQAVDPKIDSIVIDEIGKLELKGKGFYNLLVELLASDKNLHLVVRDYLLEDVLELLSNLGYDNKIDIKYLS